jgi:hypothetical protein
MARIAIARLIGIRSANHTTGWSGPSSVLTKPILQNKKPAELDEPYPSTFKHGATFAAQQSGWG